MSMPLSSPYPKPGIDWRRFVASPLAWCLFAVTLICARELVQNYSSLLTSLGDTDDATRLYQVRRLMAGASWFDMSLPRIGGDTPLISHWSRLIDAPLAILLGTFGVVMQPAAAELAARIVWPLLLLFAFLVVLTRAVEREGGRRASLLLAALSVTCMSGLYQFYIGRIDHQNGMIAGSVGGLLTLVGARRRPELGYPAGVLIGIGLAIGYEPFAIVLPAIGLAALFGIWDTAWLRGVRNMSLALAATLALVVVATIAPSSYLAVRCDALSLNLVLLAASGAAGLSVIDARGSTWPIWQRLAVFAASGVVGIALFGSLDTRCLAGPFGQINPALKPLWLDTVIEGFNIFRFYDFSPLSVIAACSTLAFGLWAAVERWRRIRTPESLLLMGLLIIAAPAGVWMMKLTPYSTWICIFCIALSLSELKPTEQLTAATLQMLGLLATSQVVVVMLATPMLHMLGSSDQQISGAAAQGPDSACFATPAIKSLDALPTGLFAGPIDFGPYIVALTRHNALAAPYHRLDQPILDSYAILAAAPEKAHGLLKSVKADYFALCMRKPSQSIEHASAASPALASSLEDRLRAGERISFLDPLTIAGSPEELKVWRILR